MTQAGPGGARPADARLGMGCVKLGSIAAGLSTREAIRLVHEAVDLGISFFDTADRYGNGGSEALLGRALAGRDDVVIATKIGYVFRPRSALEQRARRVAGRLRHVPLRRHADRPIDGTAATAQANEPQPYGSQDFSADHLRRAVIASLRRLDRNCLDLVQLHGPSTPASEDVIGSLEHLRSLGLLRRIGVGAETVTAAAEWSAVSGVQSVQLPFGVLDTDGKASIADISSRGLQVVIRGILGGGILGARARGEDVDLDAARRGRLVRLGRLANELGVTLEQVAVWYARQAVPSKVALVGISNQRQLRTAVGMFTCPDPDPATLHRIIDVVEAAPFDGQVTRG